MEVLLKQLKTAYPTLGFQAGPTFAWSAATNRIIYNKAVENTDTVAMWSLLHEAGHALLEHQDYESDFELVQLEVAAWEKAKKLGRKLGYKIDPNHIEDCLDTYRDWLYQRSTCPTCLNFSLQKDNRTYECFNCGTVWHVSQSRMCRPYRRKQKETLLRESL